MSYLTESKYLVYLGPKTEAIYIIIVEKHENRVQIDKF